MEERICAYYKCSKSFISKHRHQRFCSYRCKNNNTLTKKRRSLKQKLVDYKGGKCSKCGYDKCIDALEFHHDNPNEKDFALSRNSYSKSWDKLKVEVDKCTLLCANCHREKHCKDNNFSNYEKPLKVVKLKKERKDKIYSSCMHCGKDCINKFCSHTCANTFRRKIERPDKNELLKNIENLGYCGTGRKYGVSDNAIRKWLKYLER